MESRITFWMVFGVLALGLLKPTSALGHADLLALIDIVTKQIESDPKNAALYLRRGELYRVHADWKLAESDYDRVAQLDPQLLAVDFCRGKLCFDSGQNERARALLDKYLAGQPDHVDALMTRARLLLRLGERKAAVNDFTRAIAKTSDPMPEYFLERAQAQADDGEVEAAVRGLDEGLKRLGPLVGLELYAIELELARKNFDGALNRLEAITARSERKEKWLTRRGEILILAGRPDEARKSFAAALAAIESLPPRLRQTPAMIDLKKRVNEALALITSDSKSETVRKR
ncbi:MAG: tetratricopeptide repeat protein [Verrucomicrobia bacterium]|nr:tetratricopeptide repeat protein [Verrucomicrobiota bacterium]